MMRRRVDLPQPEGPMRERNWPAGMSREMPARAWTLALKVLVRLRRVRETPEAAGAGGGMTWGGCKSAGVIGGRLYQGWEGGYRSCAGHLSMGVMLSAGRGDKSE